jgi:hypothetical protein
MSYAKSTGLYDLIEKFAESLAGQGGIQMYDFGGSQVVMPIPDLKSGSYLTSSMCVLWKPATQASTAPESNVLPMGDGEVLRIKGRLYIAVEFWAGLTLGDLAKKLNAAKEKLLEAR